MDGGENLSGQESLEGGTAQGSSQCGRFLLDQERFKAKQGRDPAHWHKYQTLVGNFDYLVVQDSLICKKDWTHGRWFHKGHSVCIPSAQEGSNPPVSWPWDSWLILLMENIQQTEKVLHLERTEQRFTSWLQSFSHMCHQENSRMASESRDEHLWYWVSYGRGCHKSDGAISRFRLMNKYVLVVVDNFSRWMEVYPVPNIEVDSCRKASAGVHIQI